MWNLTKLLWDQRRLRQPAGFPVTSKDNLFPPGTVGACGLSPFSPRATAVNLPAACRTPVSALRITETQHDRFKEPEETPSETHGDAVKAGVPLFLQCVPCSIAPAE